MESPNWQPALEEPVGAFLPSEDFVQAVWQNRLFLCQNLKLTNGQTLEVLSPGAINRDAGPDFHFARLRINGQEWVGNVEVHTLASQWNAHGHGQNPAYESVCLHVVLHADEQIMGANGLPIPTFELANVLLPGVQSRFRELKTHAGALPCAFFLPFVSSLCTTAWLERLGWNRLEAKASRLLATNTAKENHWEQLAYEAIGRGLGQKVNGDAMEALARCTPIALLRKYGNNPVQIEALLFGQAGMLANTPPDAYAQELQQQYHFLQAKHQLRPLPEALFLFGRMRPPMFPSIRIAFFAAIVRHLHSFFDWCLQPDVQLQQFQLSSIAASEYWKTHYRLGKEAKAWPALLGKESASLLLLNAVAPLLFAYGEARAKPALCQKAISIWEHLPAERNTHTQAFEAHGLKPANALQSQGMLGLNQNMCKTKACLQCAIGVAGLQQRF